MYDRHRRVASRTSSGLSGSASSRTSPAIQSARSSSQSVRVLPELKDDVFLAHVADGEVVNRRPDALEPGGQQPPGRFGQRGRLGQAAGQRQQVGGGRLHGKLNDERDRAEVKESELAAGRPDKRPVSGQLDAGRLELDPDRRGPIADRFGRAPSPRQLARLTLQDQPGTIEVDLVADVEGECEMDRGRRSRSVIQAWRPSSSRLAGRSRLVRSMESTVAEGERIT